MAEQNHIGLSSSGVEPVSVPSDGRIMTASSIGSTSSLSEIDSQSGSLTDEPYHELLQLLQIGAPPPVKWTCVRCEVTFTSSCALLNHHVTSCLLGNIPSTTVLSTPTMVAMLRQVDPEHPVDGEPIWWVDSGDDGEEEKEEQNSEEEDWNEELGMEEFPVEAPLWLSDKQKTEWHTKRNRVIRIRSIIRVHQNPNGSKDLQAVISEWNQTFGRLPGYPRYTNPNSISSRECKDRSWLRQMAEEP